MPVIPTNLSQAIEKSLEQTGIPELSAPKELVSLLKLKGVTLDTIANELANVLMNGKLNLKHKVAMDIAALYGVDFRVPDKANDALTIDVKFSSEDGSPINVQINNMFSPER